MKIVELLCKVMTAELVRNVFVARDLGKFMKEKISNRKIFALKFLLVFTP